jgi:hypothetical protein
MRRSSLYLTLSIVSLLVAVGIGVAQKNCRYFKQHCTFNCKPKPQTKAGPARGAISVEDAHEATWDAFHARDFDTMAAEAIVLADSDEPVEGLRLRAYALRGQGRYADAAIAYTKTMDAATEAFPERQHNSDLPSREIRNCLMFQCEAYIGRAICRHHLGETANATADIDAGLALARSLAREWGGEPERYMLACAYAVQSEMLPGVEANTARLKAIGQLQRAVEHGFTDWQHARADLDLDSLRGESAFRSLFPEN